MRRKIDVEVGGVAARVGREVAEVAEVGLQRIGRRIVERADEIADGIVYRPSSATKACSALYFR